MKTRLAAGIVALVFATAPAIAQNKPEDVVKKAIDAHGGLAVLKKYPAGMSKISGKVFGPTAQIPFTGSLAFSIPGRVRMEMTAEALGQKAVLIQVVNGDKVRQTENGAVSKLDEAVKTELRESAVIQEMSMLYPLLDTSKYTLVTEKDTSVQGKECSSLLVKAKGLKDSRLYFDKKTGLLMALQRKGLSPERKVVEEVTSFSDYKAIDGMLVPMKSKVSHDGNPFLEIEVAEYKPLAKVDEKLFATE